MGPVQVLSGGVLRSLQLMCQQFEWWCCGSFTVLISSS